MYTREEYMKDSQTNGMQAHRKYFGQFVTTRTIDTVVINIGKDRLLASTNEHFNDIPLHLWDRITTMLSGSEGFTKAGDYYTLANGVCLAKEAARQFVENNKA